MNTKTKKIAVAAVAASLAGLMAVGGTLAWLTAGTEAKVNTFSVGANGTGGDASVSIQLKEDAFDGADYGVQRDVAGVLKTDFDAHYSVSEAGVVTNTLKDATYGYNQAQYILPGRTISKDPQVKNNGKNAVYVAIKLDYKKNTAAAGADAVYAASSYADLLYSAAKDGADKGVFEAITFDSNWTAKDETNTVFYYNTALDTGAETSELFAQIQIASKAAKVYGFQIDVTAYAIQVEGITLADAPAMLDKTIAGTVND